MYIFGGWGWRRANDLQIKMQDRLVDTIMSLLARYQIDLIAKFALKSSVNLT